MLTELAELNILIIVGFTPKHLGFCPSVPSADCLIGKSQTTGRAESQSNFMIISLFSWLIKPEQYDRYELNNYPSLLSIISMINALIISVSLSGNNILIYISVESSFHCNDDTQPLLNMTAWLLRCENINQQSLGTDWGTFIVINQIHICSLSLLIADFLAKNVSHTYHMRR